MLRPFALAALLVLPPLAAAPVVRVLAWDDAVAARKLGFVAGGSSIEIRGMHPLKRTDPLPVKGAAPFLIRALDKAPGADGKPLGRPCPIPETMQRPLVVLMPDEGHPTGVRPFIVDDNPANFPWGGYRFVNATPKELVVQMEEKVARIPAGWKPVDVMLGGAGRGFGARLALAEAIDKTLYSAVWEHDENVRILCFIVPGTDPRLGPVAFKAIPEDRRAMDDESESASSAK